MAAWNEPKMGTPAQAALHTHEDRMLATRWARLSPQAIEMGFNDRFALPKSPEHPRPRMKVVTSPGTSATRHPSHYPARPRPRQSVTPPPVVCQTRHPAAARPAPPLTETSFAPASPQ